MKLKPTLGTTCSMTTARHSRVVGAARLLPLLLLLTLPAVVQAQFNYTTDNGAITITGYTGPGGAVTIPSTINGLPVTRIGESAFYYHTTLTSVTIPNSVTSIGDGAFEGCTSLTAITVDALNSAYSSVDGVLFNKNLTTLIQYPGSKAGSYTVPNSVTSIRDGAFDSCTSLTDVTIGNSVTKIGNYAFYGCTLTSVTIPNSVTNIGRFAFYVCTSLTSVTIGHSVTSIEDSTFYSCTSLTNVTIGNSVTKIGNYAFVDCTSLSSVTIPNNVTNIGHDAFRSCSSLTSVTIGSSVTSIGSVAFAGCTSLSSVTIPNSVTSIGDWALVGCTSLTAITVDALNSAYSSVNGVLFNKNQTTLIQYPDGKAGIYTIPNSATRIGVRAFEFNTSLTSVTIPNSVTSIGDWALSGCTSLSSVTIPNSVTSIGDGAFSSCISLTGVYFQGNTPSVGWNVFAGANQANVYYLPGTTGWGATFAGRPTALWVLPHPLVLNNGPNFGVQTNGFGFIISWAKNIPVVVEASPDLSNPVWTPVSLNMLTSGSSYFSDPQWTNHPTRFYRLVSPVP